MTLFESAIRRFESYHRSQGVREAVINKMQPLFCSYDANLLL
jgi:hypothetical protein